MAAPISTSTPNPLRLPNPLDNFQTYSCQYVLVACRSTEVAVQFASTDMSRQRASLAAIDSTKKLGDPVIVDPQNPRDVFLVLDTRRFSQFTVENVKYDVTINGLQRGADLNNVASNFDLTIHDSVGFSFANYLQWLMDEQMQTSFDGLIFMFRVIFVGHNADGTTTTVQSETVPLILSKTEIDLDAAKGVYNMEFMPLLNFDVNRNDRWLTVSLATTYKTGVGNTLGSIVTSLETELNTKSQAFYDGVQKIYGTTTAGAGGAKIGRPVKYFITIPATWDQMIVLGGSTGAASETKFFIPEVQKDAADTAQKNADAKAAASNVGDRDGGVRGSSASIKAQEKALKIIDSYTATKPSSKITEVLDTIFKQVPEIAKLGNFTTTDNPDGYVTFYKHLVGITSDNDHVTVHVDVIEFKVSKVDVVTKTAAETAKNVADRDQELYTTVHNPNGTYQKFPKDCIEYDYIFSGRNSDILTFDMKIQDFVQLLQSDLHIGDTAMQAAADAGGDPPLAVQKEMDTLVYTRKYDPIVMPLDTAGALKNFSNYATYLKTQIEANQIRKESQQYSRNLSQFYAASPVTIVMTIKGNPLIMHKFNIGTLLPHSPTDLSSRGQKVQSGGGAGLDKVSYRQYLEQQILGLTGIQGSYKKDGDAFVLDGNLTSKSYMTSPVYIKVNIFGPNVDFKTNAPADETQNYTVSALSDAVYSVQTVVNNFSGSVFTQEITLMVMNLFGRDKINASDKSNANAGTR